MKSEWEVKPITNIVGFNPKHTVKKGALVSYVEMAAVPEHSREIAYFDNREFKSGSKFQNGDTLFSRITPCLQNGKTCRVSQLAKDEIANGSTEFIVMSAKNSIDKAFVYYSPKTLEHKKLQDLSPEEVKNAFNSDNITVFTDSNDLVENLKSNNWNNKNLLMMSSGNFDGLDFDELGEELLV